MHCVVIVVRRHSSEKMSMTISTLLLATIITTTILLLLLHVIVVEADTVTITRAGTTDVTDVAAGTSSSKTTLVIVHNDLTKKQQQKKQQPATTEEDDSSSSSFPWICDVCYSVATGTSELPRQHCVSVSHESLVQLHMYIARSRDDTPTLLHVRCPQASHIDHPAGGEDPSSSYHKALSGTINLSSLLTLDNNREIEILLSKYVVNHEISYILGNKINNKVPHEEVAFRTTTMIGSGAEAEVVSEDEYDIPSIEEQLAVLHPKRHSKQFLNL